jgi:hypothetical protein
MGSQLSGVVLGYLRAHPERLHLEGAQLVNEAYDNAWPCKNKLAEAPRATPTPTPPSSDDEAFKGSSEMDVMVSFGIAVTMAYVRCGGNITPEQRDAVNTQLDERGAMIAVFANKFKSSKCSEINAAYLKWLKSMQSLGQPS